jgi:hypothetical protein
MKNNVTIAIAPAAQVTVGSNDPFLKLLETVGLNRSHLKRHEPGEVVMVEGTWINFNGYCNVTNALTLGLKTDESVTLTYEDVEDRRYSRYERHPWSATLSKATYAVVCGYGAGQTGYISPYIDCVHIWGQPEVGQVAKVICEHLRGPGATPELFEAEKRGNVREWLATQVTGGSAPWMVNLGGTEFALFCYAGGVKVQAHASEFAESKHAIARLVNNLSTVDIMKLLPEEQRAYARALLVKGDASEWLPTSCRFYRRNGELYILVDVKGKLEKVKRNEYVSHGPLMVVREHNLFDEVFASATVLGEPLHFTKKSSNGFRAVLSGEGVEVTLELQHRQFADQVEIRGSGRYVWNDLYFGNMNVYRVV